MKHLLIFIFLLPTTLFTQEIISQHKLKIRNNITYYKQETFTGKAREVISGELLIRPYKEGNYTAKSGENKK